MTDDLVDQLNVLYAETSPDERDYTALVVFRNAWPNLRDRLTAAEAERNELLAALRRGIKNGNLHEIVHALLARLRDRSD